MNGIISKGGKPIKEKLDDEDTPTVKKVVKMLKKASQAHAGQADELEKSMKEHHQKDANGEPIPHDDEEDLSEARKETPAEFLKRGGKIKKVKAGMGKEGKKRVADFKKSFKKTKAKEDELDAKEREEREKNEETVHEAWIDTDARKVQSKWKKMDKKAKKKWMDGVMAKAKKEGMPKDELMDVLDDYGLTMEQKVKEKLESWGIKLRKEGYMILPSIDREKYTPMRGLEGPFMTRSGKVLYYDPKAGEYYDRDTDIYVSYDQYLEYDKESAAQKDLMKKGVMADPKSPQFKKMMRDKEKSAKDAKKQQAKLKMESVGMRLARKHYQGVK